MQRQGRPALVAQAASRISSAWLPGSANHSAGPPTFQVVNP